MQNEWTSLTVPLTSDLCKFIAFNLPLFHFWMSERARTHCVYVSPAIALATVHATLQANFIDDVNKWAIALHSLSHSLNERIDKISPATHNSLT